MLYTMLLLLLLLLLSWVLHRRRRLQAPLRGWRGELDEVLEEGEAQA